MNMFKKNGGFTLVELIVVIAILAILAGVAVPVYSGYIAKANEAADYTALDSVKTATVFTTIDTVDASAVVNKIAVTYGDEAMKSVSVTYKVAGAGNDITTSVNVSGYVGSEALTSKSGATSATWRLTDDTTVDGDQTGWTLTK